MQNVPIVQPLSLISRALPGCCLIALAATGHAQSTVGDTPSSIVANDGRYIHWHEHIIDDPQIAGFALSGSDGLVMGDLDRDGRADIVSVHESDSEYDSAVPDPDFIPPPEGHVRIAFAGNTPQQWFNITLAEGTDAPAPEDVALGDFNGDGFLDVVVAAELSHLIYLENPGAGGQIRSAQWQRLILPMTRNQGSYIRVFAADLDADGIPEILAANKGAQRPSPADFRRSTPVSIFSVTGDPLRGSSWMETVLGNYSVPQNAEPVDIDSDGDLDIIAGSRGENRLILFRNPGDGSLNFQEEAIGVVGTQLAGFNLEYADLNNDGRLDIIGGAGSELVWLLQPERAGDAWIAAIIGSLAPDSVTGMELGDIDGDQDLDILVGSYSRGPRTGDGEVDVNDALGRLAWFANPGPVANSAPWPRHDISRRKRGMFDKFIARDMDADGDLDFIGTRGNSAPYDGVFWLEQFRAREPGPVFTPARNNDSEEMPLP
jgi:hypothetical protein